jgi:hypothetical protein
MSATLAPQGLIPSRHPSGTIRVETLIDGVLSTYGTSIFTGTPIKRDTNGTLIPCAVGADACIGVFQGVEFSAATKRFVIPYWPAGQTYDAGSCLVRFTADPDIIYEAQANGPVAATAVGESINLANASQGSTYTGFSTQALNATTTGATAGTFIVWNLAPYDDNAWGDAYTKLLVKIGTAQGAVAFGAGADAMEAERKAAEAKAEADLANQRIADDAAKAEERKVEDAKTAAERKVEDAKLAEERKAADEAAAAAKAAATPGYMPPA